MVRPQPNALDASREGSTLGKGQATLQVELMSLPPASPSPGARMAHPSLQKSQGLPIFPAAPIDSGKAWVYHPRVAGPGLKAQISQPPLRGGAVREPSKLAWSGEEEPVT